MDVFKKFCRCFGIFFGDLSGMYSECLRNFEGCSGNVLETFQ